MGIRKAFKRLLPRSSRAGVSPAKPQPEATPDAKRETTDPTTTDTDKSDSFVHVDVPPPAATPAHALVAWLLLLLRTREDGQAEFEWMYETEKQTTAEKHRLSSAVVDLSGSVEHAVAAVVGIVSARDDTLVLSTELLSPGGTALDVSISIRLST